MAGVAVTAVIGIAGLVQQRSAAKKAASASARAREAQREASDTDLARRENVDRLNRRKAVRSERVRRSQIIQASQNTGVAGSSGEIGSGSVLGTNTGAAISGSLAAGRANEGISAALQSAGTFNAQASAATAQGNLNSAIINTVGGFVVSGANSGLFDPAPPVIPLPHPGQTR